MVSTGLWVKLGARVMIMGQFFDIAKEIVPEEEQSRQVVSRACGVCMHTRCRLKLRLCYGQILRSAAVFFFCMGCFYMSQIKMLDH